jgi:hypothetical protein
MREWIAGTTLNLYSFLLPWSQWAFLIGVVLLLPLALFKRTRGFAGTILFALSYLFGITTWLLGAGISFVSYGWLGLIIGLVVLGVGVVPVGIVGAFFKLDQTEIALTLVVMTVITYGTRILAAKFIDSIE